MTRSGSWIAGIAMVVGTVLASSGCDGDGGVAPPDGAPPDAGPCERGRACSDSTETCIAGGERCRCSEYGSSLVCEPLACPEAGVQGTACDQPGLICDPDFEFFGYQCTAPENVWVGCVPGGTIDSRCPFPQPVEGEPCCWVEVVTLDPCSYDGDPGGLWSCVDSHWVRDVAP